MGSRSWCEVLLLVVLAGLLYRATADPECRDQSQSCDKCYDTLADSLVNMRNNKYNLRRVFYPLERSSPVFVTVTYQYNDSRVPNQTWYWGAGVFYFLQPLEVFQFTSLFFGNPAWRSGEITLTLPAECANASEEFMTELTEQLKLYASQLNSNPSIDNTYKAKGFNLITLRRDLYTHSLFSDTDRLNLLYCFQFLFPLIVAVLVVLYVCWWSMKRSAEKHSEDTDVNSWAITIAHAFISLSFLVYVFALDIAALTFRDPTPEYHTANYSGLLYHYPGTLLFWDILALLIITVLLFTALAAKLAICCFTDGNQHTLLFLKLAGVVPLLSLAAHAHYIIIAWITDPLYASGIGINYAIFYVIYLVVFKHTFIGIKDINNFSGLEQLKPNTQKKVSRFCAVFLAIVAWVFSVSLQVLLTLFFVYIPVNNSIEETPSTLLTIIQGVTVVFLGLIAWKVIIDPSGEEGTLSIVSGALRKAIQKKTGCELHSDSEWDKLKDEQKLTEVLHHVIKINDAPGQELPKPGNPSQSNHSQMNGSQEDSQGNSNPPPQAVVS